MTAMAGLEQQASVEAVRRRVADDFRRHGLATPELDARLLVGHALGLDHSGLAAAAARGITAAETAAINALAGRRLAREPVARILGRKEFWGLTFRLNAETLVPRPETETVVEAVLDALDADSRSQPLRVADLGTGSGALLLALLSELPAAYGIGTDLSPSALGCARDNARALGLAARACFVACHYAAALKGPFDLIVSNPPYVAQGLISTLEPEVYGYDPRRALDGGADGLDAYRAIVGQVHVLLAPGGSLVLELGAGQAGPVAALFADRGFAVDALPKHDLSGIPRALVIKSLP